MKSWIKALGFLYQPGFGPGIDSIDEERDKEEERKIKEVDGYRVFR